VLPQVLQIRRVSLRSDVSGTTRASAGRGARTGRAVLVGLQVALSFALIAAGAGFVRTVDRLHKVEIGYRPDGVLVFNVSPSPARSSAEAALQFYRDIVSSLETIPGVRAAGAAVGVPMTSGGWRFGIRPQGASADVLVAVNLATQGYFEALGIRLVQGRLLTPAEQLRSTSAVVINEPLARLLGGNVIGRRFDYSGTSWEIVGVIDGVRHVRPRDEPMPELIIPWHMAGRRPQAIVVRADGDPLGLLPAITARVHSIDGPVERRRATG
jgi:hypothetical protein